MNVIHIHQCEECGRNGAEIPTGFDDLGGEIAQMYICRQCAADAEAWLAAQEELEQELNAPTRKAR